MDLHGRALVGWVMDSRMKTELVSSALKQTLGRTGVSNGLIIHSDHCVQYASKKYQCLLMKQDFVYIMSRKGKCYDKAPMETFL
ncbi:hypothetical protein BK120_23580 [Paenibacillus sp. FSL A5-0031]|nr:hypothetical protein BK120_23580 [Paenibacillus sp. FSL A5-0031]